MTSVIQEPKASNSHSSPSERLASSPVVVVAPDSFKGSLQANDVAAAIGRGVKRARPDAVVRQCPMADGGEGTLTAMLEYGGEVRALNVHGAGGSPRRARIGILSDGAAIVETAEIVGITDRAGMSVPVEMRDTRGVGEAIRVLLDEGIRKIYIALGGSSTNDGGAGLLVGLGMKLFDVHGNELDPTPAQIARVARIDASQLDERIAGTSFMAMSDINNTLTGENGATAMFGPQKGASADQVVAIDAALGRFADMLETALGCRASRLGGSGAAGGLGFALQMLGARMEPGAEVVARQIKLDAALEGADWLITGEGRSDMQTLHGKAPFVASQRARAAGVAASLLSGSVDPVALPRLAKYFEGCFSPALGPITLDEAIQRAPELLEHTAEQLTRLRYGSVPDL